MKIELKRGTWRVHDQKGNIKLFDLKEAAESYYKRIGGVIEAPKPKAEAKRFWEKPNASKTKTQSTFNAKKDDAKKDDNKEEKNSTSFVGIGKKDSPSKSEKK